MTDARFRFKIYFILFGTRLRKLAKSFVNVAIQLANQLVTLWYPISVCTRVFSIPRVTPKKSGIERFHLYVTKQTLVVEYPVIKQTNELFRQVRWLLNGETFSSRYVLQADDLLRFTNISVAQQGTYTCEAQNSAGTTFSRASVAVTGKGELLSLQPNNLEIFYT